MKLGLQDRQDRQDPQGLLALRDKKVKLGQLDQQGLLGLLEPKVTQGIKVKKGK